MSRAGLLRVPGVAGLVLAGVLAMSAHTNAEQVLQEYRWHHRLLLVFSPQADDERSVLLDQRLAARDCDISERDLLVVHVPASGQARVANTALTPAAATRLRNEHAVAADDFVVVLVGKDGGTKFRAGRIPDLDALLGRIDRMPMRMQEMRDREPHCSSD